ncbi:MAG: YdiY family protein [Blastocatellales bacterium]
MTRKMVFLAALCLSCPGLGAQALADEIKLNNGDRITGTIVKADGKTLVIKTNYAGNVTISAEAIAQISSDQPLYFAMSEGKTVVGTVATKEGKYEVSTKDATPVSLERGEVQAIRSKPEQDEYERSLSPSWLDLWSGGLDFGYSLTTGNTRTNTLALGSNLNRHTARDKTSLYAAYVNAKNKNKGVTETTANAIRGGGRYEIGLTNRLSAFSFADFEYNEIQLLDLRAVLGGGLGHYIVKNERAQFQVFGGGSYNRENFSNGVKRNSGEILAGEELSLKLSDRVLFRERLQFFPNLTNTGEYRVTFDSSLNTKLTRWLSWQVTASNRYLSNPVLGSKNNDLLLTTGIGVAFSNFSFRK